MEQQTFSFDLHRLNQTAFSVSSSCEVTEMPLGPPGVERWELVRRQNVVASCRSAIRSWLDSYAKTMTDGEVVWATFGGLWVTGYARLPGLDGVYRLSKPASLAV
jgi:hypothetical protein